MDNNDPLPSTTKTYNLSADVEPFVPRQYQQPLTNCETTASFLQPPTAAYSEHHQPPIQVVPSYITNCYPFVQDNQYIGYEVPPWGPAYVPAHQQYPSGNVQMSVADVPPYPFAQQHQQYSSVPATKPGRQGRFRQQRENPHRTNKNWVSNKDSAMDAGPARAGYDRVNDFFRRSPRDPNRLPPPQQHQWSTVQESSSFSAASATRGGGVRKGNRSARDQPHYKESQPPAQPQETPKDDTAAPVAENVTAAGKEDAANAGATGRPKTASSQPGARYHTPTLGDFMSHVKTSKKGRPATTPSGAIRATESGEKLLGGSNTTTPRPGSSEKLGNTPRTTNPRSSHTSFSPGFQIRKSDWPTTDKSATKSGENQDAATVWGTATKPKSFADIIKSKPPKAMDLIVPPSGIEEAASESKSGHSFRYSKHLETRNVQNVSVPAEAADASVHDYSVGQDARNPQVLHKGVSSSSSFSVDVKNLTLRRGRGFAARSKTSRTNMYSVNDADVTPRVPYPLSSDNKQDGSITERQTASTAGKDSQWVAYNAAGFLSDRSVSSTGCNRADRGGRFNCARKADKLGPTEVGVSQSSCHSCKCEPTTMPMDGCGLEAGCSPHPMCGKPTETRKWNPNAKGAKPGCCSASPDSLKTKACCTPRAPSAKPAAAAAAADCEIPNAKQTTRCEKRQSVKLDIDPQKAARRNNMLVNEKTAAMKQLRTCASNDDQQDKSVINAETVKKKKKSAKEKNLTKRFNLDCVQGKMMLLTPEVYAKFMANGAKNSNNNNSKKPKGGATSLHDCNEYPELGSSKTQPPKKSSKGAKGCENDENDAEWSDIDSDGDHEDEGPSPDEAKPKRRHQGDKLPLSYAAWTELNHSHLADKPSAAGLSYSAVLKQRTVVPDTAQYLNADNGGAGVSGAPGTLSTTKSKKKKKHPSAVPCDETAAGNKAAAPAKKAKPKLNAAIELDFAQILNAMEAKKKTSKKQRISFPVAGRLHGRETKGKGFSGVANMLDSTAPLRRRGKEREVPLKKHHSALKKIILKEREEKRKAREKEEQRRKRLLSGSSVSDNDGNVSPDSAWETQGSVSSAAQSLVDGEEGRSVPLPLVPKLFLHSRRFREYCNHVLKPEIDKVVTVLLQDLIRFHNRLYHKDPLKAKSRRRIVLGLREVTKHLKLRKLKCVILAPNLDRIKSKGGLDDAIDTILKLAMEQNIPCVFALGRKPLGRVCYKQVPVSCVGIFNYSGSEKNYHYLMELLATAQEEYKERLSSYEDEATPTSSHPPEADTATATFSLPSQADLFNFRHVQQESVAAASTTLSSANSPSSEQP